MYSGVFTDVPEKRAASLFRTEVGVAYISEESARMYQTAGLHIPEYTYFSNLHIETHTNVFLNQ